MTSLASGAQKYAGQARDRDVRNLVIRPWFQTRLIASFVGFEQLAQELRQTESRLDAKQYFLSFLSNVTRTLVFHKLLINMHHTMKFDSVEFEEYHNLYYNFTINKTFFLLRVL